MGYEQTHSDLWDVCPKDNKFNIIAKLDETVSVKVYTPVKMSDEFKLDRVVLQGTVLAPIKSSIHLETFSRDCSSTNKGKLLYRYKHCTFIPPLEMIDDILTISKCGLQAVEMNAALNTMIECKKLRLSQDKRSHMHISKRKT